MITSIPFFKEHLSLPGNDYLTIFYTSVQNSVWENDSKEWPAWIATEPYIIPTSNPFVVNGAAAGVVLELHEHVCICTEGSALHKFKTSSGDVWNYNWVVGAHNVENGYGYKPTLGMRREINDIFTMCCVGSKEGRDWSVKHKVDILTNSSTLANGASFVHVAIGSATINGDHYAPRGTAFNVAPSTVVTLDPGSSVIVCETVS